MVSTFTLLTVIAAFTSIVAGFAGTRSAYGRAVDVLALPVYIVAWYYVGASALTGVIALIAGIVVWNVVRYVVYG